MKLRSLWIGLLGIVATACGGGGPDTSSETHWLTACDVNAECGDLSCVCGVCTQECASDGNCDGLGVCAEATSEGARDLCGATQAAALCLPSCEGVACDAGLSCVDGVCVPGDCGPSTCGACPPGQTPVDRCLDGSWECLCLPGGGLDAGPGDAGSPEADGGSGEMDAGGDCGPSTCGACPPNSVNRDRCVDGEWQCHCVLVECLEAEEGGACDSESTICGAEDCEGPCSFCPLLNCSGGTWERMTALPADCFMCGPGTAQCVTGSEYCAETIRGAREADDFECRALPAPCEGSPSCACLEAEGVVGPPPRLVCEERTPGSGYLDVGFGPQP